MKMWTVRLGLSLMVVLTFWAERLPAQVISLAPGGEHIFVVPVTPYEPAHHPPGGGPFVPGQPPGTAKHRLQDLFNRHGMACESNSPWGACGNLHYDLRFIFGSCRSFFSEPCYPEVHPNHAAKRWLR